MVVGTTKKPDLLIFGHEIPVDEELFEKSPLHAVRRYLECFDGRGRQQFAVPQHVLEALAVRFLRLTSGEVSDLNRAFGGKIARQRNAIRDSDDDWTIIWLVLRVSKKATERKERIGSRRGGRSPRDHAFCVVARVMGMSAENVRRIWKKAGPG